MLNKDQIQGLQELAAAVADGLDAMDDDSMARRQVIDAWDVQVTLR